MAEIQITKKEQIIADFLERKTKNLDKMIKMGYSLLDRPGSNKKVIIKYNEDGEIIGSPCSCCFEPTKLNPFRNGAYVYSICKECLINSAEIEDYLWGDKDSKSGRRTKKDPASIDIDWTWVAKMIDKNQAKLGFLAQKYKVYSNEMKELLLQQYKDTIIFKKGRGGGVVWKKAT